MPPAAGTEWREVFDVPFDGPALGARPRSASTENPDVRDADEPAAADGIWPDATLQWWAVVRTMPHAKLWGPAEWLTARAAAETHARFIEGWKGCVTGAELRQREKQLGMTYDARRDLRIRYVPAPEPADPNAPLPQNVARLDDFRDL